MTHHDPRESSRPFATSSGLWLVGLFIAFSSAVGCSIAVDTSDLTAGDAALGCSSQEKVCPVSLEEPDGPGECVDRTSPQKGCAAESCRPCEVPGAIARCNSAGECGVSTCIEGFEDCDVDESNGCEVNVFTEEDNCGRCGGTCAIENAVANCVEGRCEFVVCSPPFKDCDEEGQCRVAPGDCSPRAPTDPDVRNSRIRLLRAEVRGRLQRPFMLGTGKGWLLRSAA